MSLLRLAFALSIPLLAAACSSSGGSTPAPTTVIVVPDGQKVVCSDGTAPPCR